MKTFTLAVVTIVVAGLLMAWIRVDASSAQRQKIAEQWSTDYAYLAATGVRGEVLHVALPGSGQVECDRFLDVLMHDSEAVNQLKGAGFEEVRCGSVKRELR